MSLRDRLKRIRNPPIVKFRIMFSVVDACVDGADHGVAHREGLGHPTDKEISQVPNRISLLPDLL